MPGAGMIGAEGMDAFGPGGAAARAAISSRMGGTTSVVDVGSEDARLRNLVASVEQAGSVAAARTGGPTPLSTTANTRAIAPQGGATTPTSTASTLGGWMNQMTGRAGDAVGMRSVTPLNGDQGGEGGRSSPAIRAPSAQEIEA